MVNTKDKDSLKQFDGINEIMRTLKWVYEGDPFLVEIIMSVFGFTQFQTDNIKHVK